MSSFREINTLLGPSADSLCPSHTSPSSDSSSLPFRIDPFVFPPSVVTCSPSSGELVQGLPQDLPLDYQTLNELTTLEQQNKPDNGNDGKKITVIPKAVSEYKCYICKKIFPSPSKLERHQVVHTGDKPFSCSKCDGRFTQKPALKNHLFTVHGIIVESEQKRKRKPKRYATKEEKEAPEYKKLRKRNNKAVRNHRLKNKMIALLHQAAAAAAPNLKPKSNTDN